MKKIFSIFLISLVSVIVSCSDNFTDVPPAQGQLTPDNIATDGEGSPLLLSSLEFLLNATYARLYGNNTGDPWLGTADNWWMDAMTDDAHKGSDQSDQPNLEELQTYIYNTANPYFQVKWETLIAGIVQANEVIFEGARVADSENIVAQARFLKGHFYFELQRIWKNVPYIQPGEDASQVPNTGPVWSDIEADFQFAIDNLPETQPEIGRVNQWTAKAYLGKVLLQQGKNTEALVLLNDVIDNGPYVLATEFQDNFTELGENGSESIFAIQFTTEDGVAGTENGNLGGTLTHPAGGPYASCCGFFQPTQDLTNAFKTDNNGLPLLDTYNESDIANDQGLESFEEDGETPTDFALYDEPVDPRLDYTVGRRGVDFNGFGLHPGKAWIRDQSWSGPYLSKKNTYKNGELGSSQGAGPWGQQSSGINYNVIRFADVLLMAAEAEVEAGSLTNALELVNRVRERAKNMTPVKGNETTYLIEPYMNFPSVEYARKAVRHERRLELAMEGHRLFDLVRYGDAYAELIISEFISNEQRILPDYNPNTFAARNLVFPIPVASIDASGNVLEQNPEWQ
ncbi:MAG: RagB/SusD family nutrient uptake outer membrane protein [Bacteroidota bacterium]